MKLLLLAAVLAVASASILKDDHLMTIGKERLGMFKYL